MLLLTHSWRDATHPSVRSAHCRGIPTGRSQEAYCPGLVSQTWGYVCIRKQALQRRHAFWLSISSGGTLEAHSTINPIL